MGESKINEQWGPMMEFPTQRLRLSALLLLAAVCALQIIGAASSDSTSKPEGYHHACDYKCGAHQHCVNKICVDNTVGGDHSNHTGIGTPAPAPAGNHQPEGYFHECNFKCAANQKCENKACVDASRHDMTLEERDLLATTSDADLAVD